MRFGDTLSERQPADHRRARVHGVDVEATVYAGVVYARAGFSVGEFVDFVAG